MKKQTLGTPPFIRKHALQLQLWRQNGHFLANSASDISGYLYITNENK